MFYDDLDPHALDSGIVDLDGCAFGALWSLCRTTGLSVVADVHTHPRHAFFSGTDRDNPMVAEPGHLALVLPDYAQTPFSRRAMESWALFEYHGVSRRGTHQWVDVPSARRHVYIGSL